MAKVEVNSPHSDTSPRAIRFKQSSLPGCYEVQFPIFLDQRGSFIKTVQVSAFEAAGLRADFVEVFQTTSHTNVLRGMHFQVPPAHHAKLVYCNTGAICDIALDLRIGSPTYGDYHVCELSAQSRNAVYLASGIAHGFVVREGPAEVVYHVTTEHDPEHDRGILWNSFDAPWPIPNPILSDRDARHPTMSEFESPFFFEAQPQRVAGGR